MQDLLQFCETERQAEILKAVIEYGSNNQASFKLGIARQTVDGAVNRVKRLAEIKGWSPEHDMVHTVPDAFVVKGTSTLYKDGVAKIQWVKTRLDDTRRQELIRDAFEAMAEQLPRLIPIKSPKHTLEKLCNLYTFTDYHMGMLAWHKETGADWDLKIAEKTLTDCFEVMLANSPNAKVGFINQLGDFLHSDGMFPVTPTSGHILDQDGRFSKIVQTTIRVLRRIVDMALSQHDEVIVLMAEGNHDMASSIWLRSMFKALYENEPRVKVIESELPYYYYKHGETMLCFHHGHLSKNDQLPILFASQFPEIWGKTTKRYCHTGHRHHVEEKEHSGMIVIQHPTLSARDAYASRGGWISERQATSITYHEKYGQVARNTVTPEMVKD
jgi:hypothetical protein